MNYCEKRY